LIDLLAFGRPVNVSVAFDDQLGIRTEEIADVITELMLPTKLRAAQLTIPKQLPEHLLGWHLLFPKFPRTIRQTREIKPTTVMPTPSARLRARLRAPSTFGRGLG
jgi:hypothetical protein